MSVFNFSNAQRLAVSVFGAILLSTVFVGAAVGPAQAATSVLVR